jgi:putative Ca2+/H+ antiporter (TMEM165/GDT1 family)
MRTLGVALLGVLTGLIAGLIASEVIGIAGVLLLHQELGIKYLPLILAAVFAALAVPAHRRARAERRGRGGPR